MAADVCASLEIGNPSDALSRLDGEDRTLVSIEGASNGLKVNAINESGLYSLVLGSRKPEAKAFKRWVTSEVLPSIRKTGKYAVPTVKSEPVKTYDDPALALLSRSLAAASLFEVPLHLAQVEATKEVRFALGVDFSNQLRLAPAQQNIPEAEVSLEPTELGKLLGLSPIATNRALESAGLQYKDSGVWTLTEAGKPFATRHHWSVGAKSGYNFKWKQSVLDLLNL